MWVFLKVYRISQACNRLYALAAHVSSGRMHLQGNYSDYFHKCWRSLITAHFFAAYCGFVTLTFDLWISKLVGSLRVTCSSFTSVLRFLARFVFELRADRQTDGAQCVMWPLSGRTALTFGRPTGRWLFYVSNSDNRYHSWQLVIQIHQRAIDVKTVGWVSVRPRPRLWSDLLCVRLDVKLCSRCCAVY